MENNSEDFCHYKLQTAIEWHSEEFDKLLNLLFENKINIKEFLHEKTRILNESKEIEKKQMESIYSSLEDYIKDYNPNFNISFEDYYDKTYGESYDIKNKLNGSNGLSGIIE